MFWLGQRRGVQSGNVDWEQGEAWESTADRGSADLDHGTRHCLCPAEPSYP